MQIHRIDKYEILNSTIKNHILSINPAEWQEYSSIILRINLAFDPNSRLIRALLLPHPEHLNRAAVARVVR